MINGSCRDGVECRWQAGSASGTVRQGESRKALLDTMLDDADDQERQCKGRFAAQNGAPVRLGVFEAAEASYTCPGSARDTQVVMYAAGQGRTLVIREAVAAAGEQDAVARRQKMEAALGAASSYK